MVVNIRIGLDISVYFGVIQVKRILLLVNFSTGSKINMRLKFLLDGFKLAVKIDVAKSFLSKIAKQLTVTLRY